MNKIRYLLSPLRMIYAGNDPEALFSNILKPSNKNWTISNSGPKKQKVMITTGKSEKRTGTVVLATSKSGTLLLRRDQGEMAVL